jgi:site-specific recombinase XerD
MKITTINTRLRALRAFYNYLYKDKLLEKNPMKNIKLLRDRQKSIETLDNKEIEFLRSLLIHPRNGYFYFVYGEKMIEATFDDFLFSFLCVTYSISFRHIDRPPCHYLLISR